MSTRFNTKSKTSQGLSPLQTGYENLKYGPADLTIPSCGIEDVDVAMFDLFDKEISPECGGIDSSPLKKVPVIFAAGEKWALLKKGRPIRDKNNTLILPLITIVRTEINQQTSEDVAGRGINQQVGEIVIRRRLDKSDRQYQNLINRQGIQNQANVFVNTSVNDINVVTTRDVGKLTSDPDVSDGILLKPSLTNNVVETIVVPTPQFYTAKYQVTVWAQYMQHTNQVVEKIFSSLLPQGQCWRLDTKKGYWFVASLESGGVSTETNFDDMSQQERFIKSTFNVSVPAYIFASDAPGAPVPVKRYVSSPVISFTTDAVTSDLGDNYVLGSDDPTLPLDEQKNVRDDQRTPGWRIQKTLENGDDPASLPRGRQRPPVPNTFSSVRRKIQGETVYRDTSSLPNGSLEIILQKLT